MSATFETLVGAMATTKAALTAANSDYSTKLAAWNAALAQLKIPAGVQGRTRPQHTAAPATTPATSTSPPDLNAIGAALATSYSNLQAAQAAQSAAVAAHQAALRAANAV